MKLSEWIGFVVWGETPLLLAINRKLEKIMHTLDDLLTEVSAQKTQVESLVALTAGIKQQLADALGGGVTPSQQMRIDAVFDALDKNTAEIAQAITDSTVQATAGAVSSGPTAAEIAAGAAVPTPPVV